MRYLKKFALPARRDTIVKSGSKPGQVIGKTLQHIRGANRSRFGCAHASPAPGEKKSPPENATTRREMEQIPNPLERNLL